MTREEKTKLFTDNYNFILWYAAKRCNVLKIEKEDAQQMASMAVWRYMDSFNPEKGAITTYMVYAINWEFSNYINKKNPLCFCFSDQCKDMNESSWLESIGYVNYNSPETEYLKYEEPEKIIVKAINGLRKCPKRKKNMFLCYYGFGRYHDEEKKSLSIVAKRFKTSKEDCRVKIKEVSEKLRDSKYLYHYNITEPVMPKKRKKWTLHI